MLYEVITFATIQKFQPDGESNVYEQLSDRTNIVVVADEAHRTQYGFKPKNIDVKDDKGVITSYSIHYTKLYDLLCVKP